MRHGDGTVSELNRLPLNHLLYALDVVNDQNDPAMVEYVQSLDLDQLLNEDTSELSQDLYYRTIEQLLQHCRIPAFGLQVGQKFSSADYGVLGYAFISSATMGDALKIFFRYQQILGSDASFTEEMVMGDDYAIIRTQSLRANTDLYRFEIEQSIGQWIVSDAELESDKKLSFTRVNFAFDRPQYAEFLKEKLNCPVYFNQPKNEFHLDKSLLDQPLVTANEVMTKICSQQCERILQDLKNKGGLVEIVRRMIIQEPGKKITPAQVANSLMISYRSLRRRLLDEGTSFQQINNDVKMAMASNYLQHTRLSTQEISFLLGYSESTNFHRAFKKNFAQTPGQYRRKIYRQQASNLN